ncbi:hypothetical protein [Burkholderia contaminans]|uniref:hypothetical protein n=1 Tax=Burkholderia contaminans TaxID=488447 RepID=UPI00310C9696
MALLTGGRSPISSQWQTKHVLRHGRGALPELSEEKWKQLIKDDDTGRSEGLDTGVLT